jgi:hypothetical protein
VRPLAAIADLQTLRILDLVLRPSPEPLDLDLGDLGSAGFLDLEDLHGFEVTGQLIHFLGNPCYISFTCCTAEDNTHAFQHFSYGDGGKVLLLNEIDHDLDPFLRIWHGYTLYIISCPRFDDFLLDKMASKENGIVMYARYMETLILHDCPNVSIAALRRLVESRLGVDVDNWNPPIRAITLSGDVPSISQADRAWFARNSITFY